RLEHAGVAGGQRRRQLPRGHQQREVPRDHLPGDPEWAGIGAEPGVAELVRPARVVEEMRRGQRDVHVPGLLDRLAVVQAPQHRELAGARPGRAGAIGYGYVARAGPGSGPRVVSTAWRADAPAGSTSASPAWATRARGSSEAGLSVVKDSPAAGGTNSPPMNRLYSRW